MMYFFTGGFLKGKRTYVIGALFAIQAVAHWAVGDLTTAQFFDQIPEILGGLGIMTLRAGMNK